MSTTIFRVVDPDLKRRLLELPAKWKEQADRVRALLRELGATEARGFTISEWKSDTVVEGARRAKDDWIRPDLRTRAGKALAERLKAAPWPRKGSDTSEALGLLIACGMPGVYIGREGGSLRFRQASMEVLGDEVFVALPDGASETSIDGCEPAVMSAYWKLKEAQAS